MPLDNAVRQWIHDHDLICDSCGKPLTEDELLYWADYENCIDATFHCGWCLDICYAEFSLSMV